MKIDEILAALAAGIVAGIILSFVSKTWPDSGLGRL